MSTLLLAWDQTGRVRRAEGDPAQVLGVAGETSVDGRTLEELLAITPAQREELELCGKAGGGVRFLRSTRPTAPATPLVPGARAPPSIVFRLCVGPSTDSKNQLAEVINLSTLLDGAPPVQISRLSSSLSHEIRNPLSSVKMAVQTLARNPSHSPKDRRRLDIANREIRTMERMLALLSEYGRETPSHLEPMPLRALILEAAATIELELNERQASLDVHEQDGVPRVKVDAGRSRPVLAQLLLNVVMGLAPAAPLVASIQRAPDGDGVCLKVEDRAATLLPEDAESLFEPFGSRLARGAGLSLAALQRVMMGQGGRVDAEPAGAGTVFTLTFAAA